MSANAFRALVLSEWVLIAASLLVEFLFPGLIPAEITEAQGSLATPWAVDQVWFMVLLVLLIMAALAATVGLLMFRRWGRSLALWGTVAGLGTYPFFGPMISSGLAAAITEISSLVSGAVLALAYYSPLSERFADRRGRAAEARFVDSQSSAPT